MQAGGSTSVMSLGNEFKEITLLSDFNGVQSPSSVDNETIDGTSSSSPVSSDDGKSKQGSSGKSGMPRTVFSRKQLAKLEERFVQQTFLSKEERLELAESLKLTDRQVMVWFQNRRGRLKRRGPADSAFTTEKLKELNSKRPYPFLSGLLTSSHFRSPHHHPYVTAVDHHPVGKVKTQPTNSYNGSNGYSYFASMESMPYQNGFFNMGSNSLQSNAMQTYNASKGLMIQRPCYSMNSLSTSPPETLAPNAAVSDHSVGKPVMTSSTKNNYSQISNVNVNMQQNTNYFNINGQQGNFQMTSQTSTVPMQANFYGNRSSPFNQGTLRSDAPASYNTSPTAPLSNSAVSSNTQTQAKYESISPPSSGALKSSPESTQTPGGWYQQNCGDYRLTHNYQPTTPQHDHDTRQSTQPTPLQSPETSPPCAYQNRQVTERVVPSNVTVNFNNFGNSHIGIDAPIDFPLSFDFPDITLQNQTQCAQQQTFVNYV